MSGINQNHVLYGERGLRTACDILARIKTKVVCGECVCCGLLLKLSVSSDLSVLSGYRGNRVGVEAPVSLTGSAVAFDHSEFTIHCPATDLQSYLYNDN